MTTETVTTSWPGPRRPFYELLGIVQVKAEGGESVVTMAENPMIGNSRGEVHGGATFGLLDAACASAARSAAPAGASVTTVNLSIAYMTTGHGMLTGRGLVLRAGKSLSTVEAEAVDEQGNVVAKAFGTMRVIMPRR